ncbi:MAG: phage terminase small subunit-related protein [Thermodesulfobacteriota bacterium]
MKKDQMERAEKMFLKAKGDITNKAIADAVGVNSLTVGRWKKRRAWDEKLEQMAASPAKAGAGQVRKRDARDKALDYFLEMGGNITNIDLAKYAGVAAATVSKWKKSDNWEAKLTEEAVEEPEADTDMMIPALDIDIDALANPGQIIQINAKIDQLLARDYLTSGEIAQIAEAKSDLLDAVDIYLNIMREFGQLEVEE